MIFTQSDILAVGLPAQRAIAQRFSALAHRDMLRRRMMAVANEAKRTSRCRVYEHAP
jgi:hypothetical protein